jgi:hypothetical protein
MKITLMKESEERESREPTVVYEIQGDFTVDELLDHYQQFLMACGFKFKLSEYFMSYDPEEE